MTWEIQQRGVQNVRVQAIRDVYSVPRFKKNTEITLGRAHIHDNVLLFSKEMSPNTKKSFSFAPSTTL